MEKTLQALYDSEINVSIWWNWDGGVEVRMGNGLYNDEKNWKRNDTLLNMSEVHDWLVETAKELYPNSDFVRKYK